MEGNGEYGTVIDRILDEKGRDRHALIPVLQAVQKEYNYLPEEALRYVAGNSDMTAADLIGVASFYSQFRLKPAGKHTIRVCVGTACHVKGSAQVYDAFRRKFRLGEDEHTDAAGKYTLEEVSCLGCCTLAPVVQIDQVTYGHVATGQVDAILADFESLAGKRQERQFRNADGSEMQGEIRIGLGSCCVASGSDEIRKAVEKVVNNNRLRVRLQHVGCVGMCHQVPLVEIIPSGQDPVLYSKVKPEDVKDIVFRHFKPPGLFNNLKRNLFDSAEYIVTDAGWEGVERYALDVRDKPVSSFLGKQIPIATEFRGMINPLDLEDYRRRGGFTALRKALLEMTPGAVIREIRESRIRGRGGAGFPTGLKWELVARQSARPKYVICNGDEGDPGAFMDRMLLESYPFRVIEGMILGAYAVGAHEGFFYIRAEYPLAVRRVREALRLCGEYGLLGENILGSGFHFQAAVYEGAGAFVCGEETALIESLQGRRGFPHIRPPFPAEKGYRQLPTLVNNVETLAQISFIIREGSSRFSAIGTENSKGTKVFALAGKVVRGGLIEVPMGTTIRQVVYEIGGGIADGRQFKAVQIGGPSGGCIPATLADTPIDFETLNSLGAMMGSGGLVVLDDTDCMVDIARFFLAFTQHESCGKCTFCRIGTRRMLDILEKLCQGRAVKEELETLERIALWTQKGSLCGLGKTAPNPVLSTLKYFREEYEAHLRGVCPTGKCTGLTTYSVNDRCIGCTLCSQACPVDAIPFTPHEKHTIDAALCIRCDACRTACPENAIDVR